MSSFGKVSEFDRPIPLDLSNWRARTSAITSIWNITETVQIAEGKAVCKLSVSPNEFKVRAVEIFGKTLLKDIEMETFSTECDI